MVTSPKMRDQPAAKKSSEVVREATADARLRGHSAGSIQNVYQFVNDWHGDGEPSGIRVAQVSTPYT